MLMDTKLLGGVPVSATESVPPIVPSSTSTGIRAPLTIDDSDNEYSVYTSGKKGSGFSSYESDSGLESDGFLSGEEGFETVSERAFVADPNVEIFKETNFVKEYVVSRPLVKSPRDKIDEESSFVTEFDDSRPFLHHPDEEIVEENDVDEEVNDSRPFLGVGTSMEEDENASVVELPVVDIGIPLLQKQGMPLAKLSWDSDDEGSESVENEPIIGVVRVPSSGVLERSGNAPKVRVLEVGEGDDSASVSDSVSEADVFEDSILVGCDNGLLDSSNQEKQMTHGLESAEVVEDKGPDIIEEARGAELDGKIEEFHMNNVELCDNAKDHDPTSSIDEETNNSNIFGTNGVEEVGQLLPYELQEAEITEIEAKDNVGEASVDGANCGNENIDDNGTVVLSQHNDDEQIDHKSDQKLKFRYYNAPNDVESIDNATLENEAQMMNDLTLLKTKVAEEPECFMNGHSPDITQKLVAEDVLCSESSISQAVLECTNLEAEGTFETEDDSVSVEEEEDFVARDGQIVTDSGDESDALSHGEGVELSKSSALAGLVRAATGVGSESSRVMFSSADDTRLFAPEEIAALDSRILAVRPNAQPSPTFFTPEPIEYSESVESLSEEDKQKLEKLQKIRVKFLRLVNRLNRSPEDFVAAKVLYHLLLAAGRPSTQAFNFGFAKQAAMELEAEGKNDLDFSLNILVIGKSGVGKSATINSIFGEEKAIINAFEPSTTSVKEIKGTLDGVQIRVLDTPGLRSSLSEQSYNHKILSLIKRITKKCSPDVVLYVDRIDIHTRDLNDLPLLKSVTGYLGSSIWYKTILALTHASSTPPEGPSGHPLNYDLFVAQKSHAIQQLISHSVGNLHILKPGLIPVSLIENRLMSERNKTELTFLSSEESWRSQLLLLCYSMKILSEIHSVVNTNEAIDYRKFGFEVPSPSLPYFMSSLLQSNTHPKISTIEGGQNVDSDIELAYSSDDDRESEDEYDQLPPFKPLKKAQITKLSKEQRNAYFEEYDYREKLLQKKQWKEEVKRFQHTTKKQKEGAQDYGHMEENQDLEMDTSAPVAVPLPHMVLPPSFDGDNPAYRYRILESSSHPLTRPVLDWHGWDHDCGYDGVNIEDSLVVAGCFPAVISVQLRKDKKEFNIQLNSSLSAKHEDKGSTMAGFDIETVGKQLAYILKAETKLKNFKVNKAAGGLSITFLRKNVIAGLKVEDQLAVGKQLVLVGSTGLSKCENDASYGANLGIGLREKDYPVGQDQSTLGLSLMRWRGDLVWGLNLQSEFSVRRNSKMSVRAGLNSKQTGHFSVRISSSDHLLIATLGLLTVAKSIFRNLFTQLGQR